MIRIVPALLLVATLAQAEVELPLGPYARLGVPVLVRAKGDVEVSGWRFTIDGVGFVHPPTLPATIEGERVEAVPDGTLLVGVLGSFPPDLASQFDQPVIVVPIDLPGVPDWYWRSLDVFDRILIAMDAQRDLLTNSMLMEWLQAGGDLVTVGFSEDWMERILRLGNAAWASDWEAATELDWRRPRIPPPGNVWREVYDLVRAPEGPESAAASARWIVAGTGLILALQLLIGALGWMRPRKLVIGLVVVAILGGAVGLVRTRSDYAPTVQGAFEIVYRDGISARVRRFEVTIATGPGATAEQPVLVTPCLFRAPAEPWWTDSLSPVPVPQGQQRLFVADRFELLPPGRLELNRPAADRNLRRLLRRVAPAGWKVAGYSTISAPQPAKGTIPLLGRVEVVPVR